MFNAIKSNPSIQALLAKIKAKNPEQDVEGLESAESKLKAQIAAASTSSGSTGRSLLGFQREKLELFVLVFNQS